MESTVPQVTASTEGADKPASQPYYKSPSEINAAWIVFEKKPERAVKSAIKTTTFSVGMNPPAPIGQVAAVAAPAPAPPGGRGGRGRGRGGRGGAPKLGSLAIKPRSSLRTKYGINVGVPSINGEKDMTLVNYLKEHPRHINAMAAGMIPTPPGVHFEIIFFLDPTDPEHQRLEELSNECRDAFDTYVWDLPAGTVKDGLRTNGFVRISDKTEERYIVLTMSTMHTVESAKFFPTPFYDQANETVLWDALVNHGFRAEVEFKVNHVMLIGTDKASFKSYVSSCKLVEEPKIALSDRQLQQQANLEKMQAAVKKAAADEAANPTEAPLLTGAAMTSMGIAEANEDDGAARLAALTAPPAKVRKTKVAAAPAPPVAAPITLKAKVKKVVAPPPPPPVVESEEEAVASEPEEEAVPSETEEASKTPVPESVMKNLSRPRRTA